MFIVSAAMPFALARGIEQGATRSQLFRHVVARSLRLILMSQILMSIGRGRLHFQLINVLAQIGITYFLCYLIMLVRFRRQAVIAALILVGHWALFVTFPGTEGPFMSETENIGARVDIFLFGKINSGYRVTINFITSTVTTLFGVWAGQLLRARRPARQTMRIPGGWALLCLLLGWVIHPWNPIIKRICTTSFTLYSGGWILLVLLVFYWLGEVKAYRTQTFP